MVKYFNTQSDHKNLKSLIYINKIYVDETSGQAAFERSIINNLVKIVNNENDKKITIIYPSKKIKKVEINTKHKDKISYIKIPMSGKGFYQYLKFQAYLFIELQKLFKNDLSSDLRVYVRYSPIMFAPLIISIVNKKKMIFRSGPILPGLKDNRPDLGIFSEILTRISAYYYVKNAHKIIVVTKTSSGWFSKNYKNTVTKIQIIGNGVETSIFKPMKSNYTKWGADSDAFIIGYVGTISKVNDLEPCIYAISKLIKKELLNIKLYILGDGEDKARLKKIISSLNIADNIKWLGPRPQKEIPSFLSICKVTLLPLSIEAINTRGSSSMKLFEYLSCDKFVISSLCDDLLFLEKKKIGKLVKAGDKNSWMRCIHYLIQNPSVCDLDGKARKLAIKKYSFNVVAKKFYDVIFS